MHSSLMVVGSGEDAGTTSKYLRHLPGLILLCVTLAPPLNFLPSQLAAVRVEDFLLAMAGVPALLSARLPASDDGKSDHLPMLFLCLALTGLSGMLVGLVGFDQPSGLRDLLLVPQIGKYLLMYLLTKRLLAFRGIADVTECYVLVCAVLASFVGMAQYWNLLKVNRWLTPLYYKGQDLEIILRNPGMNWRVPGTAGNPNVYGAVLVWLTSLVLARYRHTASSRRAGTLLAVILLLAFAIALTQSRSTLGLLATVWVLTVLKGPRRESEGHFLSSRSAILVIALVVGALGMLRWIETSEQGFGSRLGLSTASTQGSFYARVRDLVRPVLEAPDTPLAIPFGTGPSKAWLRTDSHDGYGWVLQRFGFLGVFIYIAIQLAILRRAAAGLNVGEPGMDRAVVLFSFLSVCAWMLGEFTNAIFKLPSLMVLNMFSAGWLSAALFGLPTALQDHCCPSSGPIPMRRTGVPASAP